MIMGGLFEYANDARKVKIRIGQYVAHKVIQERPFSKLLRTVEQINGMDRYELAKAFLESSEKKYFHTDVGECDPELLLREVACYIDQRIPKAYETWSNERVLGGTSWSAEELGLIYQFPENADLEVDIKCETEIWKDQPKKEEVPATERQLKYLKSLLKNAGYCLNVQFEELNVEEADQFIKFFVDDVPLSDESFKKLEYDV